VTRQPGRIALLSAFGAVYLIWGSTYLGIRYAIESIPPLLMAGSRFAIAGAVLLLVAVVRGDGRPDRGEWASAALTGLLLIGIGNGGVTWAEQTVPSGIAALVASVVPLWMTLMDWARPGGARPAFPTFAGLILGMAGLVVLLGGDLAGGAAPVGGSAVGMAVLILATIGWALGSVLASHVRLPRSPITAIGAQMTVGGGALLAAGFVAGEGAAFDPALVTARSAVSWVYLVVFGSWIGFSAYVWLLRNTSPAKASTYAFVNPLVALILGVWLASEPLDPRTVAAIAIILSGVALIVLHRGRGVPDSDVEARGRRTPRILARARARRRHRTTKGEIS
jgi:drug/metabolite transporter (DMT)-like permease